MTPRASLVVEQFGRPHGLLGALAGFIMSARSSNRLRTLGTLERLDVRPADRVLEIGFGPGLGIERAAQLAVRGHVVGLDHSELMLRSARRRNARAIAAGRIELRLGSAEHLPVFEAPFDRVFAVNVFMFWRDPAGVLLGLRAAMAPGGTIALTLQPRGRGAGPDATTAARARMATALRDAGFEDIRIAHLAMKPVDAACVLGRTPLR